MPTTVTTTVTRPTKPRPDFPLFPHQNGQWRKDIRQGGKNVPYYFGRWADDLKGERAVRDWLSRKDAILAGLDNLRASAVTGSITVGELAAKFLAAKRTASQGEDAELSLVTLGDYLREIEAFTAIVGTAARVEAMQPAHFAAYNARLTTVRKLGRHARRRVIAYVKAMFHYGDGNGLCPVPNFGTEFVAPDTSAEAVSKSKVRSGKKDYSKRIATGEEIEQLIAQAKGKPHFEALILLGLNAGMGPADLGRLRWHQLNLDTGYCTSLPRGKTGNDRAGYLWKRTRRALLRVRTLKHNKAAIAKDGDDALVFVTRTGQPLYREEERHAGGKVVGVKISNAISGTFGRMVQNAKLAPGMTFYRLRHTFKTLGKAARDKDTLQHMMGHTDRSVGAGYDHSGISPRAVKRVAKVVYRKLWPKPKAESKPQEPTMRLVGDDREAA